MEQSFGGGGLVVAGLAAALEIEQSPLPVSRPISLFSMWPNWRGRERAADSMEEERSDRIPNPRHCVFILFVMAFSGRECAPK